MEKHRKKSKLFLKLFIVFIIIFSIFNIFNKFSSYYTNVAKSKNKNYSGIGQKTANGKNGYFTTFTTTDNKTYIEYKQNATTPWASNEYWGRNYGRKWLWNYCNVNYTKRL